MAWDGRINILIIGDFFPLDSLTIDMERAIDHLDFISGQTHHSLDIIDRLADLFFETGNITTFWPPLRDPSGKRRNTIRERMFAIAVRKF